MNITDLTSS